MTAEATGQSGGQLLVEALREAGVTRIFGVPGVQLDDAVDALFDVRDEIDFTVVRHEQATTYMADGYARSSSQVGVAMTVPGPGALNALAGLATAYACSSPVLLLAGQIDSPGIGQGLGALHEIPHQTETLASLAKWNGLALRPEEIPGLVRRAVGELTTGRPRPVVLELPPDVLAARASAADVARADAATGPFVDQTPPIDADAIRRAAALLAHADKPVIYVGGGVLAADATPELVALAERLGAPVVMSENARGAISARHPLAVNALGMRRLREDADLVLAVGTRLITNLGTLVPIGPAPVITLNAEPNDLEGPRHPVVSVLADAREGLAALAAELGDRPDRSGDGSERAADARRWCEEKYAVVAPQRAYLDAIRRELPDEGVFVTELTQVGFVASMCFPTYLPRTFLSPGYQGTLGYGFATGLGAAAADPGRPVVSVTGDGGFAWTMQELSTAAKYNLGLVTIVFNDGYFGNVRRMQRDKYGARSLGVDLVNPDYGALAKAFGVESLRATSPEELGHALRAALAMGGPVLIDVPVGEFPSPWPLILEPPTMGSAEKPRKQ